jgi:GTP-binding protein Era
MVAVLGAPNAGKSTLVNRLVGEKVAIVSEKPQTTRRRVIGVRTEQDFQLVLMDTPGIHHPEDRMNALMVRDSRDALEGCDVALLVVDASEQRISASPSLAGEIGKLRIPAVLALNKIDRVKKPRLLPLLRDYAELSVFSDLVPISALTGDGVRDVLVALAKNLPEGPALFPPSEKAPDSLAEKIAEQIREPALELTRAEIPYSLAVVVDSLRQETELTVVSASLIVEREGQKAILVGKRGSMIRQIGTAARRACEERFGGRFYLDLKVRTRAGWREDDEFLGRVVHRDVLEITDSSRKSSGR